MKNTLLKVGLLSVGAVLASSAYAEQDEHFASGLYIAPGINYIEVHNIFDRDHKLDFGKRKVGANLSVGYQFDSPWAVELMYQYAKPKFGNTKQKGSINYAHLDGLYTFNVVENTHFAPYLVAGIGRMSYNTSGFDKWDTTLNAGAGIKYAFTPKFQLRADARYTLGTRHVDSGASANLALVYVFGKHYTDGANVVKTQPVVEKAAPVTAQPQARAVPETKAVIAPAVVVDTDGDGVADADDQCPDTKAGAKVDDKGCYVYLTENVEFTLNVTFASGSAVLANSSKEDIQNLAKFMTEYPDTEVTIEGHSDSTGAAAFNKRLSQQRADAVKQSLIDDFGIDSTRLTSVGYGSERPIADNATVEGRTKNRRVVAKVEASKTVRQ